MCVMVATLPRTDEDLARDHHDAMTHIEVTDEIVTVTGTGTLNMTVPNEQIVWLNPPL